MNTLDQLTAQEFKNIIPTIMENAKIYTFEQYHDNAQYLISLLSSLKPKYTYLFMQTIDSFYPALSFHFFMEARNQFSKANEFFLYRIAYHVYLYPEKELFKSSTRTLILSILFTDTVLAEDADEDYKKYINLEYQLQLFLKELKNGISSIHSLSFLDDREKRKLSNYLFNTSFENYYHKLINFDK